MKIHAAVTLETGAPMTLLPLDLEPPRHDEVLVKVVATGICHTDIGMRDHPTRTPKPVVLGHEGAGVVVEVGAGVTSVKPGDHVVMTYSACGHCEPCSHGDAAYCDHNGPLNFSGARQDGSVSLAHQGQPVHSHFFGQSAFATHAVVNARNLVPVPKDIPLELLGPLGCGFQTGAGAVINALKVPAGSSIAVFGAGSVGLAAIMAARLCGAAKIIAVDMQDGRLETALELGATHVVNPGRDQTVEAIKAVSPRGLNFAIDTTGVIPVVKQAIECLAVRGVLGLISSAKGADIPVNALHMMMGARVVRGIVQGDSVPHTFIPQLIELYRQGRFPFDRLLSFYDLADINQAIEDMHHGKAIKPVVRMP